MLLSVTLKGPWRTGIHTLLWGILLLPPGPLLEGVSCLWPMPVRCTSRALFCQSVVRDESKDCYCGWRARLLPATEDKSRSRSGWTHGFLLLAILSALAWVPVVAEVSVLTSGIRGARRTSAKIAWKRYPSIPREQAFIYSHHGRVKTTQKMLRVARDDSSDGDKNLTHLYKERQCQPLVLKSDTCSFV